MTVAVPQGSHESVYGSSVPDDRDKRLERARKLVERERAAHDAWQEALAARDQGVGELFEAEADGDLSQNELARRINLNPSTFRSIIKPLRARRR